MIRFSRFYMIGNTKCYALLLPVNPRWEDKHKEEKQHALSMNFRTSMTAFMRVLAHDVRSSRTVVLRLLAWNPWQHVFFRGLKAILALE